LGADAGATSRPHQGRQVVGPWRVTVLAEPLPRGELHVGEVEGGHLVGLLGRLDRVQADGPEPLLAGPLHERGGVARIVHVGVIEIGAGDLDAEHEGRSADHAAVPRDAFARPHIAAETVGPSVAPLVVWGGALAEILAASAGDEAGD